MFVGQTIFASWRLRRLIISGDESGGVDIGPVEVDFEVDGLVAKNCRVTLKAKKDAIPGFRDAFQYAITQTRCLCQSWEDVYSSGQILPTDERLPHPKSTVPRSLIEQSPDDCSVYIKKSVQLEP